MSAGKMKSRTNSSRTSSTYTLDAPVFFALARTGPSSSPCPRSATKAITSQSYVSTSHRRMTEVSSPPEYASTTFLTFSNCGFPSPLVWDELRQEGDLDVHPVLRLVEYGGLRALDHLLRDLLPAMGGQAVHDDRALPGVPQKARVDAVAPERLQAAPTLLLLSHAGPDVRHHDVGALRGLRRVADEPDVALPAGRGLPQDLRVRLEPLRAGDPEGEPEKMRRLHPGMGDVVAVADEGDLHPAEVEAPLLRGHQVGEHLAGVVIVGQAVDHGDARPGGHLLHRLLAERPDHDGVYVPGEHPGRVPDGLSAADLGVRRGQEQGVPPEAGHADLEGHPGPGGRLLEDHRQRLPRQRARGAAELPLALPRPTRRQKREQVPAGQVEDPEQVLFHLRPPCGRDSRSRSSAWRISASFTVSGGRRRRTFPDVAFTTRPFRRHCRAISFVSTSISIASISPRPRTFRTSVRRSAKSERPFLRSSPFRSTSSRNPGDFTVSRTTLAAAQQTGFPPKVLPCEPGPNAWATSSRATTAPSGSPLASPLARVTMSGIRPNLSLASIAPVRPIPVWISSTTRRTPFWRQSRSASLRYPGGCIRTPLSPWRGSTRKAQARSVSALSRAAMSPNGTVTNPGSIGSNPLWKSGCPVAESPPYVRPWNDPSSTTNSCLPPFPRSADHFRASLIAASFASVPLLQKKTFPPMVASERSLPTSAWTGTWNRLETCRRLLACTVIARVTSGCVWPRSATAIPPRKSRYSLPSASKSRAPSPRTNATGNRE